jgi:hypothetical protein
MMGLLAPQPKPAFEREAYTKQQINDRLTVWREHLLEAKAGTTNCTLTVAEIRRELDRWLDELSELRG